MKTTLKTEYYDNGQKKSEGNEINGKKDGLWTEWHDNGEKRRFSPGQKKSEINYKNGEREGFVTWWYENGQQESEGNNRKSIWDKDQFD